jgi:hypothetical protein
MVMPEMDERLMTFPGSENPPTSVAAAKRGRKAKVVKWYDAVLIWYVCPLYVSETAKERM